MWPCLIPAYQSAVPTRNIKRPSVVRRRRHEKHRRESVKPRSSFEALEPVSTSRNWERKKIIQMKSSQGPSYHVWLECKIPFLELIQIVVCFISTDRLECKILEVQWTRKTIQVMQRAAIVHTVLIAMVMKRCALCFWMINSTPTCQLYQL